MPRRQFYPPAVCTKCNTPPPVGDTLLSIRDIWLCPACLTNETPGNDLTTKALNEGVWQAEYLARSCRSQASGHINDADDHKGHSNWHGHAVKSIRSHGNRLAKSALIVNGEAATSTGYLKDMRAFLDTKLCIFYGNRKSEQNTWGPLVGRWCFILDPSKKT